MKKNLTVIQPVTLYLNHFLKCACGKDATCVVGKISTKNANSLTSVQVYCDDCFSEANEDIRRILLDVNIH